MKNVLLACDFANNTRAAFRVAAEIAAAHNGKVIVVHMIAIPIIRQTAFGIEVCRLDDSVILKLKRNARYVFDYFRSKNGCPENIRVKFLQIYFELFMKIQTFVDKHKIDLIVLGTGRSNQADQFLTAPGQRDSIDALTVLVISVRACDQSAGIQHILPPDALHPFQTRFILKMKTLQSLFSATLHLMLFNREQELPDPPESCEAIREFARINDLKD